MERTIHSATIDFNFDTRLEFHYFCEDSQKLGLRMSFSHT